MDSATEKLELGLQRLAKAGDDADMLGVALQSLHGALEDHFRATLTATIPAEQRVAVQDPKQVQWKDLLDLMQLYGNLSAQDRELIWRTNGVRTKVAHGGRYSGTRADLERYAALVQTLCGYTPPAKPARQAAAKPEQPATKPARAASSPRSPAAGPEIPRAVRAQPAAPPQRSRLGWTVTLLALGLLLGLALFVIARGVRPRAETAAQARAATATLELELAPITAAPPIPTVQATAVPGSATVFNLEGVPLRVRKDHSLSAETLLTLGEGTHVTIIGGPVDADGHTWWNIEVGGKRGWCAGEFLKFDR